MWRKIFIGIIDLYRYGISPYRPPSCRFFPTCSSYAKQAVDRHGAWKGAWMAVKRFFRCHPFHPGSPFYGIDMNGIHPVKWGREFSADEQEEERKYK